jgi:hypothetical protein
MKLIDSAIRLLAERGWPMFPCTAAKTPLIKWKALQKLLPTREQLSEWDHKFGPTLW